MKNKFFTICLVTILMFVLCGCASHRVNHLRSNLNDVVITRKPQNSFYDLTIGLNTHVIPTQSMGENTSQLYHLSSKDFFMAPTLEYVRSMGLVEMYSNQDYQLFITINKADIVDFLNATVVLSISLKNAEGIEVFSQKSINASAKGRSIMKTYRFYAFQLALDEAYTQALEQINWNRIASFLRTEQLPKEEPQKQVQGYGDTALENTIIRWDVQSRPQGADIFWRVVSKTPEVKSTNNKYLQTTPYEATKSLDIKGLTYQTSGDVRIILRCEKDGYLPQEKEYNVRMVIDQEEISAFFRLVKEGE